MEYLKNNLPTLKLICNCTKKSNTKKFIFEGDYNLIRALNDCVLNTLNGNINLSKKDKKRLKSLNLFETDTQAKKIRKKFWYKKVTDFCH